VTFARIAAAAVLAFALCVSAPQTAAAQQWGVVTTPQPIVVVGGDAPAPTTHHVTRDRLLITGIVFLAVGYVGAVAWGSYYIDSIHLGPVGCNDTYAGWQFLPILGPVLGMGLGGQCIPDGLHVEEAIMPALFSAAQLIGTIMTIVGALGREVPDEPQFSFVADQNGGYFGVRGAF
jgi:hypothetical protein